MNVEGKIVAVVGRAGSLIGAGQGPAIEACEYVIRVNWTLPVPKRLRADVGRRTDLLYTLRDKRRKPMYRKAPRTPRTRIDSDFRLALAKQIAGDEAGGVSYFPHTGTCCIAEVMAGGAREVHAFGFDFHASPAYVDTGKPTEAEWEKWSRRRSEGLRTHAPDLDREYLAGLLTDPRFRPDPVFRAALEEEPCLV